VSELRPRVLRLALLLPAALLLVGCLPEAATREGRSISGLYDFVIVLALIVVGIVWGLLTLAIVRYRRTRHPEDQVIPPQVGGHVGLEALWTGVPLLIIAVLFGLTVIVLDDVQRRSSEQPLELQVEAFRWGWRFAYPAQGIVVEDVLDPGPQAVVPVGRRVLVTLTSSDVIHAFYVPEFLYKRDAIPGRAQVFELTVEHEGIYTGQCAEFCGLFHSRMPFSIRAVSEAEFESWLAERRDGLGSSAADAAASSGAAP
jgi:cytochrome c oxidase subunit 2